jgi:A/G-specific adenine glycosylase
VLKSETAEAAAVRTLKEVVGLTATAHTHFMRVRHSVTRYRVTLDAYRCRAERGSPRALGVAEVAWKARSELEALALPAAHRRLSRAL